MSGTDHHLAGMGNMAEVVGMNISGNQPMHAPWGAANGIDFDNIPPGYRGHLSPNALAMPELLRSAGYRTSMVGKWHLAYDVKAPDEQVRSWYRIKHDALPHMRGFDRSFALINGGASHYAPPPTPTPMDMVTYVDDGVLLPASKLPADFYSTKDFTDRLIGYIDSGRSSGKPFFAYAAYTAPHWPLQAPDADIAAQKGRYEQGYDVARARRVERMRELGLIPPGMQPFSGTASKRWSELSADDRAREARLMEVYAAMVSNLDAHVGRLVKYLKESGQYDNTLILFMSDNGAEGAPPFAPALPGTRVDNSLENIGRPGSMVAYGPRWAEVSAAPFRLFKGFEGAEGGTSAPLIIKLPRQARALPQSATWMHVSDVLPTVLDAAGVAKPGAQYQGRMVQPIDGVSMWSDLRESGITMQTTARVHASELLGTGYVVQGRWKLSQTPSLSPTPVRRTDVPWRLFNLHTDRGETKDVAAQHPEIVLTLKAEWEKYVSRAGVLEQAQAYSGR
jgi:arylsulfatase